MNNNISPKYLMSLIGKIEKTLWDTFDYSKYRNVLHYITKWQNHTIDDRGNEYTDFEIYLNKQNEIDLYETLHHINNETLLKIAIDLGIETPDFIPSIPTFRNEIKSDYKTASSTFEKAFKQIEEDPATAAGLANSALESILKEILKEDNIKTKFNPNRTLYDLTQDVLKEFELYPNSSMPQEIKTIGSSLLAINQSIEKLRSEKTCLHGKTDTDYIIDDPIYTYFVVNSIATVGLFLKSFYEKKFKSLTENTNDSIVNDLPF